jgi:ribosomal-protein-alanine N-acetyltransferase
LIRLRDLTQDDTPDISRIYSGESMRFIPRQPMDRHQAEAWLTGVLQHRHASPRDRWCFGITAENDLVGVIKLRCGSENHATLSYIMREDAWGRGYAAGAVGELVEFAFAPLGPDILTAKHHEDNPASGRVLVKNGFARTGTVGGYELYELHRLWTGVPDASRGGIPG